MDKKISFIFSLETRLQFFFIPFMYATQVTQKMHYLFIVTCLQMEKILTFQKHSISELIIEYTYLYFFISCGYESFETSNNTIVPCSFDVILFNFLEDIIISDNKISFFCSSWPCCLCWFSYAILTDRSYLKYLKFGKKMLCFSFDKNWRKQKLSDRKFWFLSDQFSWTILSTSGFLLFL